jgi:Uncharacterised protein family (UPF0158)
MPTRVSRFDLENAFEFASMGGTGEHYAYINKETGEIYLHSDLVGELDEMPDDIENDEKYLQIPDKKELGLGKPLVLAFAREFLPDDYDKVRAIFSRRGAYARFKDLLQHRRAVDRWHAFEDKALQDAMREWCELNDIELTDND